MTKTFVSIQYLRGLAAMMVVYHHAIGNVDDVGSVEFIPYSGFGGAGVDIFFVISGFIMWVTTASKTDSPVYFWYRRIIRIVPLYWIFILAIVIPKLLIPGLFQSVDLDPSHVTKSFLFIPHYHPLITHQIWPILVPGWTLNYEMFFYFLFGASLIVPTSTRLPVLCLVFLILVGVGYVIGSPHPVLITYTDKLLLEFLAGVIIGALFMRGLVVPPLLAVALIVGAVVLFAGFGVSALPGGARLVIWGVPAILLVTGVLSLEAAGRMGQSNAFQQIGDASYSIYLSHVLTIEVVEMVWNRLGWQVHNLTAEILFLAHCLGACALVGIVAYYGIERPSFKLLRGWWSPRAAGA